MNQPEQPTAIKTDPNKWRNLRRMGWTGIFMGAAVTINILITGKIGEYIVPIFGFWGSVISLYAINSTARDGWGNK